MVPPIFRRIATVLNVAAPYRSTFVLQGQNMMLIVPQFFENRTCQRNKSVLALR